MNFPAWHDQDAWMKFVREMKALSGALGVRLLIDMPNGQMDYDTADDDDDGRTFNVEADE